MSKDGTDGMGRAPVTFLRSFEAFLFVFVKFAVENRWRPIGGMVATFAPGFCVGVCLASNPQHRLVLWVVGSTGLLRRLHCSHVTRKASLSLLFSQLTVTRDCKRGRTVS